MAELADAAASKPVGLTTRVGSSPTPATRPRGNPFWSGSWKPTKAKKHTLQGLDSLPETPDMMPEQFHPEVKDHRFLGERGLMLATLEQAVADFQKYAHAQNAKALALFEHTRGWFEERSSAWPYSYTNICTELDIDPDKVYRALCKWREENHVAPARRKCHSKERGHGRQHASR